MSKPTLLLVLLVSLAAPLVAQDADVFRPNSFHVGTHVSALGARVDAAGQIDTGDGIVSFFDASTGEALVPFDMQYRRGPKLIFGWSAPLGEATVDVRMASIPLAAGGDKRLVSAMLVSFENASNEPIPAPLGLRMTAGGPGTAEHPRPVPHLPFDAASRYTVKNDELLRDDRVVMRWVGMDPEVDVTDAPSGPDADVCTLSWNDLVIPPRTLLSLSLFVVGPPTTPTVNESRFRRLFESQTYVTLEERTYWEIRIQSTLFRVKIGDKRLFRALRAAIFTIGLFSEYGEVMEDARAHPYNFAGTTLAERAERVVPFIEWDMTARVATYLHEVVAEAEATIAVLEPAERVAVAAALAQCARLSSDETIRARVALLLNDHICDASLDGLPVRPWLDPEVVATEMREVLDDVGFDAEPPELAWADVEEGSTAALLQDLRRAISARDFAGIEAALASLGGVLDANTIGRLDPDGEPDDVVGLALLSCVRAMMIDDHGDELQVLPAVPASLIGDTPLDSATIPTRFGRVRARSWWSSNKRRRINLDLFHLPGPRPDAVVWRLPDDRAVDSVRVFAEGDQELRGDHEVVLDAVGAGIQLEVKFAD